MNNSTSHNKEKLSSQESYENQLSEALNSLWHKSRRSDSTGLYFSHTEEIKTSLQCLRTLRDKNKPKHDQIVSGNSNYQQLSLRFSSWVEQSDETLERICSEFRRHEKSSRGVQSNGSSTTSYDHGATGSSEGAAGCSTAYREPPLHYDSFGICWENSLYKGESFSDNEFCSSSAEDSESSDDDSKQIQARRPK